MQAVSYCRLPLLFDAQRKFIIADTPGHEQYTRNMATGASTANLAIRQAFSDFAQKLDIPDIRFAPISALRGTNVARRSPELTPWYSGASLLELLETVDISQDINTHDFRFPVQVVVRPHLNFRGFAGTVVSGTIKPGDKVRVLPSQKTSSVKQIVTADGALCEASAPQAVTLELADEVDISSGDMIVRDINLPSVKDRFEALVIWMSEEPLRAGSHYLIRHAGRFVKARIEALLYAIDVNSMEQSAASELPLNGIGRIVVETTQPRCCETMSNGGSSTGSPDWFLPKTDWSETGMSASQSL